MSVNQNKVTGRKGFINRATYNAYKAKYPNDSTTYEEFITILKESNKDIREHILENPIGFKLPYNFGYMAVDKFKGLSHYVAIDWVNTRKLGKRVPLTNFHSFGYFYKIKLFKNPKIKPLFIYKMDPHRVINRMLAKRIKAGKNYLSIDKSYYSKRFRIGDYLKLH